MNLKKLFFILTICLLNFKLWATEITHRIPEFTNDRVNVWQTIIYPTKAQKLKLHRHDYNRVVVAFNNGTLKIMNDKGKTHYLHLEKNRAYYLTKDAQNELHTDENISGHPIKVLVIELKP